MTCKAAKRTVRTMAGTLHSRTVCAPSAIARDAGLKRTLPCHLASLHICRPMDGQTCGLMIAQEGGTACWRGSYVCPSAYAPLGRRKSAYSGTTLGPPPTPACAPAALLPAPAGATPTPPLLPAAAAPPTFPLAPPAVASRAPLTSSLAQPTLARQ